jgi:hypothetical protein
MPRKTDAQVREDLREAINNLAFMIRGAGWDDDVLAKGFDDRAALTVIRDIRNQLWTANSNTARVMAQIHHDLDRLRDSFGVKPELA